MIFWICLNSRLVSKGAHSKPCHARSLMNLATVGTTLLASIDQPLVPWQTRLTMTDGDRMKLPCAFLKQKASFKICFVELTLLLLINYVFKSKVTLISENIEPWIRLDTSPRTGQTCSTLWWRWPHSRPWARRRRDRGGRQPCISLSSGRTSPSGSKPRSRPW